MQVLLVAMSHKVVNYSSAFYATLKNDRLTGLLTNQFLY